MECPLTGDSRYARLRGDVRGDQVVLLLADREWHKGAFPLAQLVLARGRRIRERATPTEASPPEARLRPASPRRFPGRRPAPDPSGPYCYQCATQPGDDGSNWTICSQFQTQGATQPICGDFDTLPSWFGVDPFNDDPGWESFG